MKILSTNIDSKPRIRLAPNTGNNSAGKTGNKTTPTALTPWADAAAGELPKESQGIAIRDIPVFAQAQITVQTIARAQKVLDSARQRGQELGKPWQSVLTDKEKSLLEVAKKVVREQGMPGALAKSLPALPARNTLSIISVADPAIENDAGGHLGITVNDNDLMLSDGLVLHQEYIKRENKIVPPYRNPTTRANALLNFMAGSFVPVSQYLGINPTDFHEDPVTAVNLMEQAASAAFRNGTAEVKIEANRPEVRMNGDKKENNPILSSKQMLAYLGGVHQKSVKRPDQVLSAQFNLHTPFLDDRQSPHKILDKPFDIAMAAVEITAQAGLEKVTFDGSSDAFRTSILDCLSRQEMLQVMRKVRQSGLIGYIAAGMKIDARAAIDPKREPQDVIEAFYRGAPDLGIGTDFHDNVQGGDMGPLSAARIKEAIDLVQKAQDSVLGQGVALLSLIDDMHYRAPENLPKGAMALGAAIEAALGERSESTMRTLLQSETAQGFLKQPKVFDSALGIRLTKAISASKPRYNTALVARLAGAKAMGPIRVPGIGSPPSLPGKLVVVNKGPSLRSDGKEAKGTSSISIVDLKSGEVLKDITHTVDGKPLQPGPHEVELSPNGRFAAAPNYGLQTQGKPVSDPIHGGGGHSVTIVDTFDMTAKNIDLSPYFRPHGITWLDEKRIIVTCDGKDKDIDTSGYLLIVNTESDAIEKSIATGEQGTHLVKVAPDGERLFATNIQSGSVTVASLDGKIIKTLKAGKGAEGFDISPDGKELWVGNLEEDTLSIFDTKTLEPIGALRHAGGPIRVVFLPDEQHVAISDRYTNDIAIYDWQAKKEITRIPCAVPKIIENEAGQRVPDYGNSSVPMITAAHPTEPYFYFGNSHAEIVTVVDSRDWSVAGFYKMGTKPDPLVVSMYEGEKAL